MGESGSNKDGARTIGLFGATAVGVGAIVGGGILVLAGIAFDATGPGAVVAFGLNGIVALLTAMSFAEMSTAFPESGGAYTFAKKVVSVRAAFAVGWVLWFAYIVAGTLYALGFASFATVAIIGAFDAAGSAAPDWISTRNMALLLATLASAGYAVSLIRKTTGGGNWATRAKVVVFAVLIVAGIIALLGQPVDDSREALTPFLSEGFGGLLKAMGFTFIALQGFDLIPAIAGEIKNPGRVVPRAMFLSLTIALAIYLPLLFLVATVGVPAGVSIGELAAQQPETVIAVAIREFMGPVGYWFVIVAAILSTLTALHANMLAASRVSLTMARDRTLPNVIARVHSTRKTPVMAIYATVLTLVAILFMVPNLASAGAAASLIFLLSFTLAHGITYLARKRGGTAHAKYKTPLFPLIPIAGGAACAGLALFQAVAVPEAGGILIVWLGLGSILYLALFRSGAETADASAEALDPSLVKLRGRNPLVLLPIANPAHARSMVQIANALAPSQYARVLLLSVVTVGEKKDDLVARLGDAQRVVQEALTQSYGHGQTPEALITAAEDPWHEIRRIAVQYSCDSMLLGLGEIPKGGTVETHLNRLINDIDCDIAIMKSVEDWQLLDARRVLVPVGGRGEEHGLRARLLSSIARAGNREFTFVTVLPADTPDSQVVEARRAVAELAAHNLPGQITSEVVRSDDPIDTIVDLSNDYDLVVLGIAGAGWGKRALGRFSKSIARRAKCPTILLSRKRSRAYSELYRPLRDAVGVLPWTLRKPELPPGSGKT